METLTLYSRPACCLCRDMKAELERRGFLVVEVDIDQDDELLRRYAMEIPVAVRADGTVFAKYRL